MASSVLSATQLTFTSDGTDVNARITATNDTFTFTSNGGAPTDPVALANIVSTQIQNGTSGNGHLITSASTVADLAFILPTIQGSSGTVLANDGSGNLSWTPVSGVFRFKDPVVVATTTDITLTSPATTSIDGVTIVNGDRILVKDGSTANPGGVNGSSIDNGIWVYNSATTDYSRAIDLDTGDSAAGVLVVATSGTTNADTLFLCDTDSGSDIVGTDALTFSAIGSTTPASGSAGDVQFAGSDNTFNSATAAGDTTSYNFAVSGDNGTLTVGSSTNASGAGTFSINGTTGVNVNDAGSSLAMNAGTGNGTGSGGNATISGGNSGGGATGNGGGTTLSGGDAVSTNGTGGGVSVTSGTGSGTGTGGGVTVTSGTGGATGTGGAVTVTAGSGGATSGTGGAINVTSGSATQGAGGDITVTAADGVGTNQNGGNLTMIAGSATGSGTDGQLTLGQNGNTFLWPTDAPVASEVLTVTSFAANVATLEWAPSGGGSSSVGTLGEVQFADGSGGFESASVDYTETRLTYTATGPAATLQAGNAAAGATGAGSLTILGNNSAAASGFAGSAINLTAGNGDGAAAGGDVALLSGTPGVTGVGGDISLTAGPGGSTSGNGGNITMAVGTVTSGTAGSFTLTGGDSSNTTTGFVYEAQDGTDLVTIVNGNITATNATTGTLVVNGGAGFSGDVYGTTFNATSDVRFKENFGKINDPLSKILAIDGCTYDWKDKRMSQKRQIGLLAQQLEEVGLGDVVTGTEESKSINYMALIPIMIEAIKELAQDVYKD